MGSSQQALLSRAASASENAKTTAWVNAVVAAGGTVSAGRRTIINNLFNGLDGAGLTTLLDRLWLLAAENATSAAIDLIGLQSLSLVNSPTFTTDRGYTGNGTSSYILTGYTPNTGAHLTQNSAHFSIYNNQANGAGMSNGATGADPAFNIYGPYLGSGDFYGRINEADSSAAFNTGNTTGYYIADRTGVGTVVGAKNGTDVGTNTTTSSGVSAVNIPVLAVNNFGGIAGFSADRAAAASMGASLGSSGRAALSTHVNTYMTAIGANVY